MSLCVDLTNCTWKPLSVGWSSFSPATKPITHEELKLRGHYFSIDGSKFGRAFDHAVLMFKLSFIEDFEAFGEKSKEVVNVRVIDKRLSDVINLHALVESAHIWEKQYPGEVEGARSYVEESASRTFPDSVELGFDKDARTLPNCPTKAHFTAVAFGMGFDDREALALWSALQRAALNIERRYVSIGDYSP